MNIYKLSSDEIKELSAKFNKTPFGIRAVFFAYFPGYFAIVLGAIAALYAILHDFEVEFINTHAELNVTILCSLLVGAVISLLFQCVTSLQYGKMLKEFADQEKKK